MLMTKATLERVDAEIRRRRTQVDQLHAKLEDLEDYLDVLAARQEAVGKRTFTQVEIALRYQSK